jgi:acyl dehydratase
MRFAEFRVGQIIAAGPHRVSEAEILSFASQWDPQPFHTDAKLAASGRWRGLIASGWHTCAIAMRLAVTNVLVDSDSCGSPGLEYLEWSNPVRPGDELTLSIEVLETRRSRSGEFGIVKWKWELRNQHGQPVLETVAVSLFENPPAMGGEAGPEV